MLGLRLTMSCPDAETLARHAEASLDAEASERVRQHVDGCAACRELLVTLVRTSHPSPGPAPDAPWDVPVPGTQLGRYRVTGTRGAGGMGVVLAAYDPQLDRQVAIKVLRPDLEPGAPEKSKLRLVREAQLMARVRHPNVVTVHDVVLEDDRVFIAMELVEGQTLRDWLEAAPRSPAEIVARFLEAGRGLCAAHAAGVVHRDFKPDNVLLDAQGHVLVSDFGLAWSEAAVPAETASLAAAPQELSRRSLAVGTPAYMAPEQLGRERVDARADQFSFCVALWEALHGERPFDAEGRLKAPKKRLGPGLETALRRGLARAPDERFPSMEALLAALTPRPARSRRWWAVAAVALVGLVALGLRWREGEARCRGPRELLAASWTAERRAAFASRPSLGAMGEKLAGQLDDLVADVSRAWEDACAGTDERLRTCLASRVETLHVTAAVLAQPQADLRISSTYLARAEGPDGCAAGEVLTLIPLPEGKAELARTARIEALTADALRFGGDFTAAEATARKAIETAQASTWRPAEAEARLALAQVFRSRGRYQESEAALADALLAAEAGRHFEAIARIAIQHILVVGAQPNRPEQADPWVKRAEAALEQLPRPRLRAEVDVAIAMLRAAQGQFDEALRVSDRALAWFSPRDPLGAADLRTLRALNFLQFGLDTRALEEGAPAAETRAKYLGEKHPLTLHARITEGEALARLGRVKKSIEQLTWALDAARESKAVGPVTLASGLVGLALALDLGGQPGEALNAARQADALVREALGPKHRYAALSGRTVGERLASMGRDEEADAALAESIAISAEAVGPEHRETLDTRARRALIWARRGKPEAEAEARLVIDAVARRPELGESPLVSARLALATLPGATKADVEAALEVARRVRGPQHPDVARALRLAADRPALEAQLQAMDVASENL